MVTPDPVSETELKVSEKVVEIDFLVNHCAELRDRNPLLLHRVAVANSHSAVCERVVIDCDAERSTDGILTAISLADRVLLFVLAVEIELEIVHYLLCELRKAVLLHERQNCCLDGSERRGNAEHDAGLTAFELLLLE